MRFIKNLLLTLALILMMTSISVFAEGSEYKEVLLNKQISFTFNGEVFVPTETDGSVVYPITYNDRTYIPARFIAEKAGLFVTWDMTNQIVGFEKSFSINKGNGITTPQIDTPVTVTALINHDISFKFEEEEFIPMEADGTRVYPITYNDRTYIPARFIAEKAGLTVTWDETNKVVGFKTGEFIESTKGEKTFSKNDIKVVSQIDFSYLTNGLTAYISNNSKTDDTIYVTKMFSLPTFDAVAPNGEIVQQETNNVSFTNSNEVIFFAKSSMCLRYYIKTDNAMSYINNLLSAFNNIGDGATVNASIQPCNSDGDTGLLGTLNKDGFTITFNAYEYQPGYVLFQIGDPSVYLK
ncbi:MAG: copper amine oxidase N-terminal domain-containing protein [Clostridia bacterium]|nr:copper amine oxidase N-terminal domain-containing protein [Clostridia bacterium]